MADWRYFAQRLTGDRGILVPSLPLTDVTITNVLSGSGVLSANLPVEILTLKDKGKPILEKWSTALWAERNGKIMGGGILVGLDMDDGKLNLDCMGIAGYPNGMPYVDSEFFVEVDPLDLVRHIWEHLQSKPRGNLGVRVDDTKSPIKIGIELDQGEFDDEEGGSLEDGAIRFSWYETTDLGSEIDNLAEETPFDYCEQSEWSGEHLIHRIRLGYPRLGTRRHDLRFVFGENIAAVPSAESSDEDWGNEVLFLGAGEGRQMIHTIATANHSDQLRRVAVVVDKSVKRTRLARKKAKLALSNMVDVPTVTEIEVRNHSHAPLGSWELGDEIYVQAKGGWVDIAGWYRIMEETIQPQKGDSAVLSLAHVGAVLA